MPFVLMVMVTDAGYDRVEDDHACGSMSFCGVRDRYPDRRNMGYPFDRPFGDRGVLKRAQPRAQRGDDDGHDPVGIERKHLWSTAWSDASALA